MEKTYFPLWYRLDGQNRYLIWFSSGGSQGDGVVVGENAVGENADIPIFADATRLMDYAATSGFKGINFSQPHLHNLDRVGRWLQLKSRNRARGVDCVEFLSAWNLFADVANSLHIEFDTDKEKTQKIYDKLFWGNNLEAVTPEGKFYEPVWSRAETRVLHEVLATGMVLFRGRVKRYELGR